MSDDAPTERFPAPGSSANGPTEPLGIPEAEPAATEILYTPAATAPVAPVTASSAPAQKQSRALLYTLLAIGAALLIAVIVVVVLLVNRSGDDTPGALPSTSSSPSASPSPSATPSETPTAEPEPEESEAPVIIGPTFDSFTAPSSAGCAEGDATKPLKFTWSSSNAVTAYIGVAVNNAKDGFYEADLPVVTTYTGIEFTCSQDIQFYTVTLEDADGRLVHQTVTITR